MTECYLHYVGKKLYNINRFEREAKRYGVQRAIPFRSIKDFEFGNKILLAHYMGKKENATNVFGYFRVEEIVNNLPEKVREKLIVELDVVAVIDSSGIERRACGSYAVGGGVIIENNIKDLIEKTIKVCEEEKVDPVMYKWFLKGSYTSIPNFIMKPAKFTRGYRKIEFEGDLGKELIETKSLGWIRNYKGRRYLTQREEQLLDSDYREG